jgi:hypothetical protein
MAVTSESGDVDICFHIITEIQVFNINALLSIYSFALASARLGHYH